MTIALVHYYSKSIEEFLVKADQSVPPYIRVPIQSYDSGPICQLAKFNYSQDYQNAFRRAYQQLNTMSSLKITALLPPPMLNIKTIPD